MADSSSRFIVPAGFRYGGTTAGIKASGKPDLALILADEDVPAAAVFTRNRVKAAPVLLSRERVKRGRARGVLVNAGNANACTGPDGMRVAETMTQSVAEAAGIEARGLLVASTGVIGVPLPVDKIVAARESLLRATTADAAGFERFYSAILTTDRGPKTASASVQIGKKTVRLLGCCKGAGMIMPNMATTLGFVTTDAAVDPAFLRAALREATDRSFNQISVDGDTSTNDTIFAFASGRADNTRLGKSEGDRHAKAFTAALKALLEDLALQIVGDGEGATKTVTFEVIGAESEKDADRVARRIGLSPLVKTALFGCDPNWGRILAAVGNAGVKIDPARLTLDIGDVRIVEEGVGVPGADTAAHLVMKTARYVVRVNLHRGRATGRHITCDLGHDYVTCNADYRT